MRVEGISLYTVRLPLVHTFETSSHRKSHLDHILVKFTDEDGAVGWGEIASPSDPWFSSETVETATMVSERYLVPAVLGHEWERPENLALTWLRIRGHEFAKAGFDIAAWDLFAKSHGSSLAHVLGGTRRVVDAGVSVGIEPTVAALVKQVAGHVAAGYKRVKLKIKPGWDSDPVRAVVEQFPDITVHVDANAAYPSEEASMRVMEAIDALDVALVEQPFAARDFVAHSRLQQRIATPVCLDESIVDPADIDTMVELDAGRSVNIKVSRMGGLTPSIEAHARAQAHAIPVWCGGMHEFGVGRAANVALSSLPGFTYPSDVSASAKYYAQDLVEPPIVAHRGSVQVSDEPGIGHLVVEARVRDNCIR